MINSVVKSIDQKVTAIVENNELKVSKGLYQRVSEKHFEIFDDYNIPVLQVLLNKKDNSLRVNGVFFSESMCTIISDNSIEFIPFEKPFLLMNPEEKNNAIFKILGKAKKITLLKL